MTVSALTHTIRARPHDRGQCILPLLFDIDLDDLDFEVVAWCGFEVSEDLLEVEIVEFVVFLFLACLGAMYI